MKLFATHAVSLLVGFSLASFLVLQLAQRTSLLWQNNLKVDVTYSLQREGSKAALAKDWARAQYAFQASERIQSTIRPHEWDTSLPLFGWGMAGMVKADDQTFWLSDMSIIAYSLEQQGKTAEAAEIYTMLIQKYPGKDQAYFKDVAQRSLSALGAQ